VLAAFQGEDYQLASAADDDSLNIVREHRYVSAAERAPLKAALLRDIALPVELQLCDRTDAA
jgi:hypothetical protein